jgi:hypothetical protein
LRKIVAVTLLIIVVLLTGCAVQDASHAVMSAYALHANGAVLLNGIPTHPNNRAAINSGMYGGYLYRTKNDIEKIAITHGDRLYFKEVPKSEQSKYDAAKEAAFYKELPEAMTTVYGLQVLTSVVLEGLPFYSNNAEALAAGMPVNMLYRTGGDPDYICIVHGE